ncbi:MAG: DUF1003 domain-containing protein [Tannerella sp.]|jgi:uncharacterized membrane protein|nr:DUF1003 domain-containing protein [Tannerella sp.]
MNKKQKLVKEIIKNVHKDMTDEELIRLILDSKISKKESDSDSFGARAADALAGFAGSWVFVIGFAAVLLVWIIINAVILVGQKAFDPYPFVLLNLVLSCVAATQAPLIMMSQNRQEAKDRKRAENDYMVNLKTEIIIEDIHHKLEQIIAKQKEAGKRIDPD